MSYSIKQLPLLPGEIQDTILRQLSIKNCWQCAAVCQEWRRMILQWQPLWETLSSPDRPDVTDLLEYTSLINSNSVKRIYVQGSSAEELHEVIQFIDTQRFHSITHVDLNVDYFTTTDFDALIERCGNTLVDITMRVRLRDQKNVRPDAFLRHCPQLSRLHFDGWISNPQSWHPLFNPHPLSELTLLFANIDDFQFDPTPFLQMLPSLKRLRLDCLDAVDVSLLDNCPELEILAATRDPDNKVPKPGRKKLLSDDTRAVPELFDIIQQWAPSLELLYLEIWHEETLERLATFAFPSLTFVYIRVLDDSYGPALRSFFTSSTPSLFTLHIDYIDDNVLDGLATAAKSLNCLLLSRPNVSDTGLTQFLNQVDLRKITIRFDYTSCSKFLEILGSALDRADRHSKLDVTISVYMKHLLPTPSSLEKLIQAINRNVDRWKFSVDASLYLKSEHIIYQGTTDVKYRMQHL